MGKQIPGERSRNIIGMAANVADRQTLSFLRIGTHHLVGQKKRGRNPAVQAGSEF